VEEGFQICSTFITSTQELLEKKRAKEQRTEEKGILKGGTK
jgi:hypothetical protein